MTGSVANEFGLGNFKEAFGRSSVLTHDLTYGRCQMFISRSQVYQFWLNAPEMNVIVHRFMYI